MSDRSPTASSRLHWSLPAAGIVLLTLAVYMPVLTGDYQFLWDDRALVSQDPLIRADDGLWKFWFSAEPADYWPLTSTTFWLEWRLWGGSADGYHLANVLLHAINAVLVWVVLKRLKVPAAWLAAAVFAVHPVCVASAAWISERKNTLSMVLVLLAMLAYLRFDAGGSKRFYALAVGAFLLALLSKTSVVMLPVVLLACAWWLRGRIARRDVLRSLPFFALSVGLGLVTIAYQGRVIGREAVRPEGPLSRIAAAGWAPWFYIYKAFVPVRLALIYPRWDVDAANVLSFAPLVLLAAVLGALAVAALLGGRAWARGPLMAMGCFVAMLAPVLGLLDMSWHKLSLVADHFQYVPIVAVIALVVGSGAAAVRGRGALRNAGIAAAVAVVVLLGAQTWRQQQIYKDDGAAFADTLAKNPRCWLAHDVLGIFAYKAGDSAGAVTHFQEALRLRADYPPGHNNLAMVLARQGRFAEAETHYRRAVELRPSFPEAHFQFANLLGRLGRHGEAVEHFQRALADRPDHAATHCNLGIVLARQGRFAEAIERFTEALRLRPDYEQARRNLQAALDEAGKRP